MARERTSKQLRDSIAVIVDGETEQWYLKSLCQDEHLRVRLVPELPCKTTIDAQYKQAQDYLQEGFSVVYWVIDLDVPMSENRKGNPKKLEEIKSKARELKDNGQVKLCINNPCLEYFFLLHFTETKKYYPNYDALKGELNRRLDRMQLPKYSKTEKYFKGCKSRASFYACIAPYSSKAIERAKKLLHFAEDPTGENPHAEIYSLVEYLLTSKGSSSVE